MSIDHIRNRIAALAQHDDNHDPREDICLLVYKPKAPILLEGHGDWLAAIVIYGERMPLLDNEGHHSLAATGATPLDAMRELDAKLGRLP